MATPETTLAAGSSALGWALDRGQVARLISYLRGVLAAGRHVNLLGPTSFEDAVTRHLLDSLALGPHLREVSGPAAGTLLDLGSGGGFPGVPLAIALPEWRVHLVEGRGRKVAAVTGIVGELGIGNVRAHRARLAELLLTDEGQGLAAAGDVVTARAVAPLGDLVREAAAALRPGGTLVCWKATTLGAEERTEGLRRAEARGLEALPDLHYRSDQDRILVRYRRAPEGESR